MRNPFKDFKRQLPIWMPKPRVRYWYTGTIVSYRDDKEKGMYAWSNPKDRDAWAELMEKAASRPEVIKGKVQRERADKWMEVL